MKVGLEKPGHIHETLRKYKAAEGILKTVQIFQLTSTEILIVSSKISNLSDFENFSPIQDKPFWGCSPLYLKPVTYIPK